MYTILLSTLLASTAWPVPAQDTVPLYDNLGTHEYSVSTRVPLAQAYFNQGLRLYYAFNHAEAIRSFREAQRRDSTCAMCFWGEALAWGPNINAAMDSASGAAAWAAITQASNRLEHASAPERELIYGAELMAPEEREAYRRAIERAGTKESEAQVRERHRERLRKRARDRGVELKEPHGVVDPRK